MENKKQLYDRIIEMFCFERFYYEDLCIETPNGPFKVYKRELDLIVFNNRAIIIFVPLLSGISDNEAALILRATLNCLADKLSISIHKFIVCGTNEERTFFFNNFNDRISSFRASEEDVQKFLETVDIDLQSRPEYFDYNLLKEVEDKLVFSSSIRSGSEGNSKIKTARDGTIYIRKHGTWKEASEVEPNQLYLLASLTGMLGGHLFYLKKPRKGILYLLTFGLFGIGWFFDSLEIMFGIFKDTEGKYILPISSKAAGLMWLILGAGVFFMEYFAFCLFLRFCQGLF